MDKDTYLKIQHQIILIGKAAAELDLDSFIKQISSAQTIGPFVDPTLYREASDNIQAILDLTKAIKTVANAHHRVQAEVLETAVKRGRQIMNTTNRFDDDPDAA